MSSQSTQISLGVALSTLPYDVINEIFYHCLPQASLDQVQPNAKIAPMLLCHVCSSWRVTVLASPSLWSRLYFRLPITWAKNGNPVVWDSEIFRSLLECLEWWRKNQGSSSPFLRLESYQEGYRNSGYHWMADDAIRFLVEYLRSAQYLDVDIFLRYLVKLDSDNRYRVGYPKLHTLVPRFSTDSRNDPRLPSIPLDEIPIPPTLRRISVHVHDRQPLPKFSQNWSRLTHLSLRDLSLHPTTWFLAIRALSALQWGYFSITILKEADYLYPPHKTLPFLSTLSVNVSTTEGFMYYERPLSIVFLNLELPALKDLAIYSKTSDWWTGSTALKEVNDVLRTAPVVRKLALGPQFLYFEYMEGYIVWGRLQNEPPLSALAPHLTHLELDLCCVDRDTKRRLSKYLRIWKDLFFSSRWLDFTSPMNTVRTMTIFVKDVPGVCRQLSNPIATKHAVEVAIEEYVWRADNVRFEVCLQDQRESSPDGWKTWF